MRVELHCHSTCSDGTEAPAQVAARAAARGVEIFALTDHDTTAGRAEVPNARNLRAVELTCDADGAIVHVLAYDRGGAWSAIEDRLAEIREARRQRLRVMADRLAALGVVIDVAPMLADAEHRSVGRPDLARAVVAAGAAATPREAFAKYLHDGGPVDVAHRTLSLVDALAAGRAANAAMSLAHPHFYDSLAATLVRRYRDEGLTGIEAFYGVYDSAARRRWIGLADELGLVCTGGSDWHGKEKAGAQMNSTSNCELGIDIPPRRVDALVRWLT